MLGLGELLRCALRVVAWDLSRFLYEHRTPRSVGRNGFWGFWAALDILPCTVDFFVSLAARLVTLPHLLLVFGFIYLPRLVGGTAIRNPTSRKGAITHKEYTLIHTKH